MTSPEKFRRYQIGQVSGWPDIDIFLNAGIGVIESQKYSTLYPMLNRRRFDYLPLSIVEAKSTLERENRRWPRFELLENIYIYYPIPIYLRQNTSAFDHERLRDGFEILAQNGKLEEIFDEVFTTTMRQIKPEKSVVFLLNNPKLSAEDNLKQQQNIVSRFFSPSTKTYNIKPANQAH
jgi:hypothetical protein